MLWSQTCASSCFFSSDDRPSRGQTGESANRYLHLQHENYLWRERQRKNKLIIFQLSFPLCTGEINHLLCFKQWCSLEITNIHHKRYFLVLEYDGKHTRRITPHTMTLFFFFFFPSLLTMKYDFFREQINQSLEHEALLSHVTRTFKKLFWIQMNRDFCFWFW